MLHCYFCGSTHIRLPSVGISFGMWGNDYSFCEECIKGMTADDFWEEIFKKENLVWPPKLEKWAQDAVNKGLVPSDVVYGWGNSSLEYNSNNEKVLRKTRSKNLTHAEKERRKMTNSLRYKIMRRDKFCCVLCGATGKEDILVVDHIIPISANGKTVDSNLRTLCSRCNSGKGSKIE